MSDELKYYPPDEKSDVDLYYVEFDRGDKKGEFTLFKRQTFRPWAEIAKIKDKNDRAMAEMCNHCHPWNIFTGQYGQDGCVPDKAWVCWMVDSLNFQCKMAAAGDGIQQHFLDILNKPK
jgi:hypothetical protein